jgi:hypothetical protein
VQRSIEATVAGMASWNDVQRMVPHLFRRGLRSRRRRVVDEFVGPGDEKFHV